MITSFHRGGKRCGGRGLAVGVGLGVPVGLGVTVEVSIAVGVGVGSGVGVGVGSGPACTANDPMSMRPLRRRQKLGPALII